MKTQLESYWQSLITDVPETDEVGLGIDGMLGDDVVKLLAAIPKKSKPLTQRIVPFKPYSFQTLDEHELAMV